MFNEITEIVVGGMAGLIFGSFVAFLNYRISKHYVEGSKNSSGMLSVMSVNIIRMLVNAGALAVVFFLRNTLPWPFISVAIGMVLGLSVMSTLLLLLFMRKKKQS